MLDMVGFGYAAFVHILLTDKAPSSDSVAVISEIIPTIGADAPIVSLISAGLGMKVGLITNMVGRDEHGNYLLQLLRGHKVQTNIGQSAGMITPQIFDIRDPVGSKTILTLIGDAFEDLSNVDLTLLDESKLAYVDFYTEIGKASLRVIHHAKAKHIPLFVNLSSSDLSEKIALLRGEEITIVQASLEPAHRLDAPLLAADLLQEVKAEVVLITLGSMGAICSTRSEVIHVPAYHVKPIKTAFGAGAAFSAGFAFGYFNQQWELKKSLKFACALGSMNCRTPNGIGVFLPEDVFDFIQTY